MAAFVEQFQNNRKVKRCFLSCYPADGGVALIQTTQAELAVPAGLVIPAGLAVPAGSAVPAGLAVPAVQADRELTLLEFLISPYTHIHVFPGRLRS